MFGSRGGYRQEDHLYRRGYGRFGDGFARRPYYGSGNEHDDVRRPYETRFAPVNVNQQYGKQSTGEPMFDEQVFDSLRATANKAAEFVDNVTSRPLNYKETFERMYQQAANPVKAEGNKADQVDPYQKPSYAVRYNGG